MFDRFYIILYWVFQMNSYKSQPKIDSNLLKQRQKISLPKLRTVSQLVQSKLPTISPTKNKLSPSPIFSQIEKSKRSSILLKQIRPAKDIHSQSSSSDGEEVIQKISTPDKRKSKPELTVLTLNQNKKQRMHNRYTKQLFIGQEAVQKFYDRYKNIEKVVEKQMFQNHQSSILTQIVQLLEGHGFAPRRLDLIKLKGTHAILDLKHLGLGHGNLGNVVTQLISLMKNFQYVDLSHNGIDRQLSDQLIPQLQKVLIVNLNSNRIGKVGCQRLSQLFLSPKTQIQQLLLSDNGILDNAGAILIKGIGQYGALRVLDLSKNFMGVCFAVQMKEYLGKDRALEELYLGWNQIHDKSAKLIFQAIQVHTQLKVLDYSWNILSFFSIPAVAKTLSNNQSLLHIDLSFCQISLSNSQILSKSLQSNHTCYGIHFEGNGGYIDRKGYLRVYGNGQGNGGTGREYPIPIVKGLVRKIDGVRTNTVHNQYKDMDGGVINRDVCWICDCWQEVYFTVKVLQSKNADNPFQNQEVKQCYLHIKSQGWQSIKMQTLSSTNNSSNSIPNPSSLPISPPSNSTQVQPNQSQAQAQTQTQAIQVPTSFFAYRMHSISPIYFFFTFNYGPGKKYHFASSSYQKVPFSHCQPSKCPEPPPNLQFNIGQIKITSSIPTVNIYNNVYLQDVIDQNYFPNIHCIPRSQQVRVQYRQLPQPIYKQTKKVLTKRKIVRKEKVNAKYRELDQSGAEEFLRDGLDRDQDKEFLMNCLEFDISHSKISKLIKTPQAMSKFKQMMLNYYVAFKDAYYFLANSNPSVNGIYNIPELQFVLFLQEQKYVTKRVTLAKIMLKMISCLAAGDQEEEKKQKNKDKGISPSKMSNIAKDSSQKKGLSQAKLFSRPQFLQFLIRLALQKWCIAPPKPKKPKQPTEKKQQQQKQQQPEPQQQSPVKQPIVLPLPLLQGLERTMRTLPKYADRVRASIWRKQKYLTIDIYTVIKGYEMFLKELFQRYAENKRKLDKPRKLKNLLTLQQFKNMLIDADIKRTKQAAKDCEVPFLDSKRLQLEDGIIPYGLSYPQFLQLLARYAQILYIPPVSCPTHQLWQFEPNRRFIPLYFRMQSLICSLYRNLSQFHTRRLHKITQKGIFQQQTQIFLEKVKEMDLAGKTVTDLTWKINNMEEDLLEELSLRELIKGVKEKYQNMEIQKVQEIDEEQERIDD